MVEAHAASGMGKKACGQAGEGNISRLESHTSLAFLPSRGRNVVHDTTLQMLFQAVSALAVVGGFVYAALQFRGWRTAQYVANFTTLLELQLQLRKMVVDDPTLAPVGLALPAEDQGKQCVGTSIT